MPTYVYKCDTCKEIWEESFPYEERDRPIEDGCTATTPCDGKIMRIPAMPGFAYDNISSPGHLKKTPGWMKDRLKDIKRKQPGATMSIPD
tara:strand:+ start:187 stop:456 length:270 start_codon:yes stop_codon:yes gene_type:complete